MDGACVWNVFARGVVEVRVRVELAVALWVQMQLQFLVFDFGWFRSLED